MKTITVNKATITMYIIETSKLDKRNIAVASRLVAIRTVNIKSRISYLVLGISFMNIYYRIRYKKVVRMLDIYLEI